MAFDPAVTQAMAADVSATMADQTSTLEFRRQTVVGTSGVPVWSASEDPDGILPVADLEWCGLSRDFEVSVPAQRDTVRVDGTRYFVMDVQNDGAAVTLTLKRGPES